MDSREKGEVKFEILTIKFQIKLKRAIECVFVSSTKQVHFS